MSHPQQRSRRGQAASEVVLMMGMTIGLVIMLALLLYTFKEFGGRILNLLASDYP